jgi:transcriptional regulator with XRE-family HTH domain
MELYTKFSDILKDLIDESDLSLRKLATQSNVSANQYSKYLRGSFPTIDVAVRIANYFDCSLDYLFGLTDVKKHCVFRNCDLSLFVCRYIELLKDNDITHWKFAQKYGLSESCLRHWKCGEIPKIESLIIIASNLYCSLDYLVGRTDKK